MPIARAGVFVPTQVDQIISGVTLVVVFTATSQCLSLADISYYYLQVKAVQT